MLTATVIQPFVLPSNAVHPTQLPSRPSATVPQSSSGDTVAFCGRCHLYHASSRACPRLLTEAQVRLALDEVRIISRGDPTATKQNKGILQQVLKMIAGRNKDQGRASTYSTYLAQQSRVPTQRAPQQPEHREQPHLVAPVEEDSSESQSGSDSGSDSSDNDESGEEISYRSKMIS